MKDNINLDSLYCEIFHQKYMYNIITDRRNKPTYGSLESASELLFLNHIRHLIIKRTCSFYIKAEFEKHCLGEGNQENQNNLEVILDSIVFFPKHKLHIPYITCITGKGLQFTLISQDCYQNVILKRSEAGIISLCVLSIYGIGVGGLNFFYFKSDLIIPIVLQLHSHYLKCQNYSFVSKLSYVKFLQKATNE